MGVREGDMTNTPEFSKAEEPSRYHCIVGANAYHYSDAVCECKCNIELMIRKGSSRRASVFDSNINGRISRLIMGRLSIFDERK